MKANYRHKSIQNAHSATEVKFYDIVRTTLINMTAGDCLVVKCHSFDSISLPADCIQFSVLVVPLDLQ